MLDTNYLVSDDFNRRQFLLRTAQACLGVSLPLFAGNLATALEQTAGGNGKAKHVIYLFMEGAMSQLDTFDPKPGSEFQGETTAINTTLPGVQFGQHFPKMAEQMNKIALVRSLSTETGAHEQGQYIMRTSFKEIASIRHPAMGAWSTKVLGKINPNLPGNVLIGNSTRHPGAGYWEARYSPVPVGNPQAGLQNTKQPSYLKDDQFDRRMKLTSAFDTVFQRRYDHRDVKAYSELYSEAIKLLKSEELLAFDITKEPEQLRADYGDNTLGKGCLLARRLIENGVRFVEVNLSGWDMHREVFVEMPKRAEMLDTALSTLLKDLEAKGMLDETLVVLATEFGRTPKINENIGRDHHPGAFSGILAGAGIKVGQVYGASDKDASSVARDGVSVPDFNATIAAAMGLPLAQEFIAPGGRPFRIADHGKPVAGLLS